MMNKNMPPPENLWEFIAEILGTAAGILSDPLNIIFVIACIWAGATYKRFAIVALAAAVYAALNTIMVQALLHSAGAGSVLMGLPFYLFGFGIIAFGIGKIGRDLIAQKNNLPK